MLAIGFNTLPYFSSGIKNPRRFSKLRKIILSLAHSECSISVSYFYDLQPRQDGASKAFLWIPVIPESLGLEMVPRTSFMLRKYCIQQAVIYS